METLGLVIILYSLFHYFWITYWPIWLYWEQISHFEKVTVIPGFPCVSAGKESSCNVGDLGSIPGLGRSPGEENSYPLHYSGLENSMDYVYGVAKSQTWLSYFHLDLDTVKIFSVVNETEVDVFLKFPCFFCDPADVGNLISGSSAFSKSNLYIWKFLVHLLLKPGLKDFQHNLANTGNDCNCMVIWTFFGIAFLWDWNENWPFPVLWPLLRTC